MSATTYSRLNCLSIRRLLRALNRRWGRKLLYPKSCRWQAGRKGKLNGLSGELVQPSVDQSRSRGAFFLLCAANSGSVSWKISLSVTDLMPLALFHFLGVRDSGVGAAAANAKIAVMTVRKKSFMLLFFSPLFGVVSNSLLQAYYIKITWTGNGLEGDALGHKYISLPLGNDSLLHGQRHSI